MNNAFTTALGRTLAAVALTLVAGLSSAHAYVIDTKIGSSDLQNSSDANELAAMEAFSGDTSLVLLAKVNASAGTALPDPDTAGQFYIDVGTQQPLYFLLKFGVGGTSSQQNTFFFQNIGELNKLVFSSSQVNFLSGGDCGANGNGCNIGRLSHYDIFGSTGGSTDVPEPATMALVGLGLLGFAASRRKARAA